MKHQIFAFAMLLTSSISIFGLPKNNPATVYSDEKTLPIQKMFDGGFVGGVIITINPNPTFGKTTITLTSELPVQVQLHLLDAAGNEVAILSKTQLSSGSNQLTVNFSGHPSGIYYLKVAAPSSSILKKIVLL